METIERKRILIVDDEAPTLWYLNMCLGEEYAVFSSKSGREALDNAASFRPDIILLDIIMPGMDGYETLREFKSDSSLSQIPIIFLTSKDDADSEIDGLSLGAVDYITKPLNATLLKKRIELHLLLEEQKGRLKEQNSQLLDFNANLQLLVEKKTEKITKLRDAIMSAFAEFVEFRDTGTGGHIDRTKRYVEILIDGLAERGWYDGCFSEWDRKLVVQSAPLHDMGKVKIPDSILNKHGNLTFAEFEIMKTHTVLGRELITKIAERVDENELLRHAAIMAYSHHERWDGSGYPEGLSGTSIPLQGRLMAIADVYDALISERPYKVSYTHEKSMEIIRSEKGAHFDPLLTDLFCEISEVFRGISSKYAEVD